MAVTILRRVAWFVVAFGAFLALLIWSLPVALPFGLMLAGIPGTSIESVTIGFRQARLSGLAIGNPPRQKIKTIETDYDLFGLISGRVDSIRLVGLVMQATYEDGKLSFGDQAAKEPDEEVPDHEGSFYPILPITPDSLSIENSRLDIATPLGPLSLPVSAKAVVRNDRLHFDLESSPTLPNPNGSGQIRAKLNLSGEIPRTIEAKVDQAVASGRIEVDAMDLAIPGMSQVVSIRAAVDLGLTDGRLTAKGPISATDRTGVVDGDLSATLLLNERLQPTTLEQGEFAADLRAIKLGDAQLDEGQVTLKLDGEIGSLNGALNVGLEGLSIASGSVKLRGIDVERNLDLSINDQRLAFLAQADGKKISVDRVTIGDDGDPDMESGWFTVQWPARDDPWLSLDLANKTYDLDWAIEIDPVRLDLPERRLWARIEDLNVALAGDRDGLDQGSVRIRQGRADLPDINLALAGIESDLRLGKEGLVDEEPVPLSIRAIRPLDEPRLYSPLKLEALVDVGTPRLGVEGTLRTNSTPPGIIDVKGWHDRETGSGRFEAKLPSLSFRSGQLQPSALAPILEGVIDDAEGSIAMDGWISWQDGDLDSDLAVLIDELGFSIGPARLSRINSVIRFDSLSPLSTPEDQLLSVGLLDVGLPLTDGLVSMQLRPDGQIAIDQLAWRLANGEIKAEPFTFGSDVKDLTLMLRAEQLDLDSLLRLTPLDDLTGEGLINGTLPLTIGEFAASIAGGELAASAPGVLRYTPSSVPGVLQAGGESVKLMLQALENFRYDALKITLDGRTDGATAIGLHLNGANPGLYDGHPVEFNLNLDGNLASLIQTNLENYQIPDRIRERIQGFER
jgi:hypothetical protein